MQSWNKILFFMLDHGGVAGTLSIKLEVSSVTFNSNMSFVKYYLSHYFKSVESALVFYFFFFNYKKTCCL